MATFDDVAQIVAALPGTEQGTAYGSRAWRFRKKLLVWERPLRKTERVALGDDAPGGDLLGLRVGDLAEKDELIAAFPGVFFTTPHLDGTVVVCARLAPLPVDVLDQLVRDEWRRRSPEQT